MRFTLAPATTRLEPAGRHLIVFDEASWDTHILNEAAGALLLSIAEEPRTVAELTTLLRDLLMESERARAEEHTSKAVEQLRSLGLIVPTGKPL